MEIEALEAAEPTAADAALAGFACALDHLIEVVDDGGLDGFDGPRLVNFLQRFEQTRNRTALVDHRALRMAESVRLAETVGQPNLKTVLSWALRLSSVEAARRVRAAEQVGEQVTMTGEPLPPRTAGAGCRPARRPRLTRTARHLPPRPREGRPPRLRPS